MAGIKPKGYQLNINDIATEISSDANAIQQIATSIVNEPGAISSFNNLYVRQDGSQSLSGNLNCSGNDIVNVGTVDGRDISVDGSNLDLHLIDTGKHRIINDGGTSNTELWSAQKINNEFQNLTLTGLNDTAFSSPQTGEVLIFNGSTWGNLSNVRMYHGEVQTTDEQVTTVLSIQIPVDNAGTFIVSVQGFEVLTGNMRSEIIHGAIKHTNGTVIVVGSNVIDLFEDVGTNAWSLTAVANNVSKTLDVNVVGQAGKTIMWRTKVDLLIG